MKEASIRISERAEEIDIVASYDRTFDYHKLQIAFDAIWYHKRARLVTTNPDHYCPFPGGRGEPNATAIVATIEACTGAKCEVNVGKPDAIMLETVMNLLGLDAKDCVMTSDRLYTDIRMALDAGMSSGIALTSETRPEALATEEESNKPTYVLARIGQLIPQHLWKEFGWTGDDE